MTCHELDSLVHPYLDGEFSPAEKHEVESHLAVCGACAKHVDVERRNLELIRSAARAGSVRAPESLKLRIGAALDESTKASRRRQVTRFTLAAAGIAICAVVGQQQWKQRQHQRWLDDAAARHARQFPLEIQKLSPAELEAWFGGKLNHRVDVPRFPNAVASGARLLNVREHDTAYIRYDVQPPGRNEHRAAGLFVYGDREDEVARQLAQPEVGSSHGYNVVSWRKGDLNYLMVTDLTEEDVRQMLDPKLLEAATPLERAAQPFPTEGAPSNALPRLEVAPAGLKP